MFAAFSMILSFLFVWYHELYHWFGEIGEDKERLIFAAIIIVPALVLLVSVARRATRMFLSAQSPGFRICVGAIFVGVTSFLVVWFFEEELDDFLDCDDFLEASLVVMGIYLGLSLFWNMVGRIKVGRRAASARLLIPCYLTSMVFLGFMPKVFYLEEKYWLSHRTSRPLRGPRPKRQPQRT
ncbi:hypothetical protein N9A94_04510 [Akkermansiaceae bacterium]|nr:hypothetical protein [Akkermansiaceae bacterium]